MNSDCDWVHNPVLTDILHLLEKAHAKSDKPAILVTKRLPGMTLYIYMRIQTAQVCEIFNTGPGRER